MDGRGPRGADRLGDVRDLIDLVVRAVLVQIGGARRLLHVLRPVAGHVQAPVFLADRRAGDGRLAFVQVAAVERRQAIDAIIGVEFVLAAGDRVLAIVRFDARS